MKRKIAELSLVFLLFFFIPDVLFNSNTGTDSITSEGELSPEFFIIYTLIVIPKILLFIYILMINGEGIQSFGFGAPKIRDAVWTFIAACAAWAVLIAGSNAVKLLQNLLPANLQEMLFKEYDIVIREPVGLALSAVFCVVVAYKEELFFRSYLYKRCLDFKFPETAAVLIPSLIFGMFHLAQGWAGAVIAFLVGLFFQLVYQKTRNLHVVAASHFLYNFSLMIITYFGGTVAV